MTQQSLRSSDIVQRYLAFFKARGHLEIPGSPLVVPSNSTSFIIAGMQPLQPYLQGLLAPPASRLVDLQRCLRGDDADMVGSNARKLTAFHMLGNWSLGDYGHEEAIGMALEFLIDKLKLSLDTLWVTVFAGDPELCLLQDDVSIAAWRRGGIAREHIVSLGIEDNLWTMGEHLGPCGPCTEIFVDRDEALGCGRPDCRPGCDCDRFLEIWNLVFMEYEFLPNGSIVSLPQRNVDTGMGLERIASVLQETDSVFTIDLFQSVLQSLEELVPDRLHDDSERERRARRIIVDHMRSTLFAGLCGVEPGRDGRNSVVRRLIRRAARQGRILGIERPFLSRLIPPLAEGHRDLLTEKEYQDVARIAEMVIREEQLFAHTLTLGLRYLERLQPDQQNMVSGEQVFRLHSERGFPADMAAEILAERGLQVNWQGYEQAMQEHQRVSRASMQQRFHQEVGGD